MPIRDIEKRKAYHKAYNKNYKRKDPVGRLKQIEARRSGLREWLRSLKVGKGCSRCPEDHPACLEYHHVNPEDKDQAVAEVITRGWSKNRIQNEIAKCILLCANCHRKEHDVLNKI